MTKSEISKAKTNDVYFFGGEMRRIVTRCTERREKVMVLPMTWWKSRFGY
jgi:hypothetical protein